MAAVDDDMTAFLQTFADAFMLDAAGAGTGPRIGIVTFAGPPSSGDAFVRMDVADILVPLTSDREEIRTELDTRPPSSGEKMSIVVPTLRGASMARVAPTPTAVPMGPQAGHCGGAAAVADGDGAWATPTAGVGASGAEKLGAPSMHPPAASCMVHAALTLRAVWPRPPGPQ